MLIFPKKTKFTKNHNTKKQNKTIMDKYYFGNYAIIAKESGYITNIQIESSRKVLRKLFKKQAKILRKIFTNKTLTKKPQSLRMGKGKGNNKYWYYFLKKGEIIFELNGLNLNKKIKKLLLKKISLKTLILQNNQ